MKFYKYTTAINGYGVEVHIGGNGGFSLRAHRNGRSFGRKISISAEQWESRPFDYYDDLVEARWALSLCGVEI